MVTHFIQDGKKWMILSNERNMGPHRNTHMAMTQTWNGPTENLTQRILFTCISRQLQAL